MVKRTAEEVGFEPTEPFGSSVFKTDAIDRSATPPYRFSQRRTLLCTSETGGAFRLVANSRHLPLVQYLSINGQEFCHGQTWTVNRQWSLSALGSSHPGGTSQAGRQNASVLCQARIKRFAGATVPIKNSGISVDQEHQGAFHQFRYEITRLMSRRIPVGFAFTFH